MRTSFVSQLGNPQLVLFLSRMTGPPNLRRVLGWCLACVALLGALPALSQSRLDDMAERTRACAACHGEQGRAGPDGYYPRIAGKPAGYLYNQLLNFKEGRRHYGLMTRLVDPLTDAYLWDMAQYFASLDVPYPPPSARQPATTAQHMARGRQLALEGDTSLNMPACTSCHGERLTGLLPHAPGLLGLPRDYVNAQLGAWRSGQRRAHAPDCMAQIAKRLSADDLTAVATWLGMQALPANTRPSAGTSAAITVGQAAQMSCGTADLPAAKARP